MGRHINVINCLHDLLHLDKDICAAANYNPYTGNEYVMMIRTLDASLTGDAQSPVVSMFLLLATKLGTK